MEACYTEVNNPQNAALQHLQIAEPTSRPDLDANKLANMRLDDIKNKRLTDMELSKEGSPDRI